MSSDSHTIGKYKLVNCIASGQSTQIWEVLDTETTRRAAMKLLLPEKLTEPEMVGALKSEFKVASTFDHPNILKYEELFANKKNAYFTMELFNAPNLKTQLYNDIRSVHIRLKRLVELVAMALEHIHDRGWVHRDIKPDNILMNKSSEVRVIDFSLACRTASAISKMLHRKQLTVKGTRTYMAPEQILGKPLTPQTDIYNFGVTLFELLTGETPFKGSTPKDLLLRHISEPAPAASEFNPNVSPQMDLILQRMLAKKPEQRHKKVAEFMAEFRNVPLFKEEVTEKVELTEKEQAEKELQTVLGERLDSRTDHMRTKFGRRPGAIEKEKEADDQSRSGLGPVGRFGGQGGRPPAPVTGSPPPMQPQMQPMMPGMYPGQMPMQPYPGMPWVSQMPGQPGGMPAGPWMQPQGMPGQQFMPQSYPPQSPPPQSFPPQPYAAPQAGPLAPPVTAPVQPVRPAPVPPPTAVPVVPVQPAAKKPPVEPKPAPAKARPAPAAKPGEGFHIEDLAGFDDLPPVS